MTQPNDTTVTIPLTQGKVALVDAVYAERVLLHRWSAVRQDNNWYAQTAVNGTTAYLHRVVMDAPLGVQVDHKDGNGLDCRRANLRFAQPAQNIANSRLRKDSISGYKGVQQRTATTWRARIRYQGQTIFLGTFTTPEDAALAYDASARFLYGEFARTNFPPAGYIPAPKAKPIGREIEATCVQCSVVFLIFPYEVDHRLYCSKACKYAAARGKPLRKTA